MSTRFGVVGGAIYITTQEGLWASPEEAILCYQKFKEMLPGSETVISKDYQEQIAAAVEKVSSYCKLLTSTFKRLLIIVCFQARVWSNPDHKPLAERWNGVVLKSFKFIDSAPSYFSSELKSVEEKAKKYIS